MHRNLTARGRGLALLALVACTTTAAAHGATAAPAGGAAAPAASVSMAGGGESQKVAYGRRVKIVGTLSPRRAGTTVRLEHAPSGQGFRPLDRTRTRSDGSYRFTPRARRSGAYRAVSDGAAASARRRVTVVGSVAGRATRHVIGARAARVRGRLLPALAGRAVRLQLATRRGWRTVDRTRTGRGGRFRAAWRPRSAGVYHLRVRSVDDRFAAAARDRLARVRAYRPGHASWYGPGLYGNRMACGGTLTPSTLGVAHKSLPCGTRVTFRHRGRSATVRVVDRGPFVAGREWDLTEATKRRLGFGSTGTVWSTR